jgi:GNAT superfamily N-acetyltransferase
MGTELLVSNVNTPDFFARAKAYENHRVWVACEGDELLGSTACAWRQGMVNGSLHSIGYQFQSFTAPSARRRGVAARLLDASEQYLAEQGARLAYALIMQGNHPSQALLERRGFKEHCTLVMTVLPLHQPPDDRDSSGIRIAQREDHTQVASLLNQTWGAHQLFPPAMEAGLTRLMEQTPGFAWDQLLLLEEEGAIRACLGFWDWSRITHVRVLKLSHKMRATGMMFRLASLFKPLPRFVSPGDTLKQWMLSTLACPEPGHFAALLNHLAKRALDRNIRQIFWIHPSQDPLTKALKGYMQVDSKLHLYLKPLRDDIALDNGPVYIDGIDL